MRYLVTGATGFIGLHLCQALVDRGDSVLALVRTPAKAAKLPDAVQTLAGDLTLFAGDVTLPEVDVVIHLAGVVAAPTADVYEAINFTAVKELVNCLERQSWSPKRLVFASSLAAAGPSSLDRAWTEKDPLNPIDPYGEAKMRAEAVVRDASFPTTCFRPCIVLGPNDSASLTLFKAAQGGVGIRVGSQAQQLSFVDVRDVITGILHMSDDTRDGHYTYYVSHPEAIDTERLWAGLGRALGRRVRVLPVPALLLRALVPFATLGSKLLGKTNQLDLKQYRQMVAPAFVCSSAALSEDLSWQAEYGLDATLAHATAGYRASGALR
ncbi:MAG: NAD-dependent epimerase/dehydratase family protein [Rhodobacterales bacterium]|nr:NAD-dependent epimerase/dehydratase family protein [Rhodobacterales bacterium]